MSLFRSNSNISLLVLSLSALKARFNDIILIEPYVKQFNGVRLTMGYSITNKKTGNIVLTGETKHCFTDTSLKPIRLQNHIPEFYEKFISFTH